MNLSTFFSALAAGRDRLGLAVTHQAVHASDLPKGISVKEIFVNAETSAQETIKQLCDATVSGAWVLVHLEDGSLPGSVYNQLRQIATTGHVQMRDADDILLDTVCPEAMRIVVVVEPNVFSRIPIPTFINLFGPVYRAEG